MKSTVSSQGQVTIPRTVRTKLGLRPGTVVFFELEAGGVMLRKQSGAFHPVDRVFGRLKLPQSVDHSLDELRGPRPSKAKRP